MSNVICLPRDCLVVPESHLRLLVLNKEALSPHMILPINFGKPELPCSQPSRQIFRNPGLLEYLVASRLFKMPSLRRDSYPAYRLSKEVVQDYLEKQFGAYDFSIQVGISCGL